MYAIIEWNQAGGSAVLADTTVYDTEDEAIEQAEALYDAAAPRKDRYCVYQLDGPTWLRYEDEDVDSDEETE